jgi:surface antigen
VSKVFLFTLGMLSVLLVGCASVERKAFNAKKEAIQLPLTALPDGASFTWRESTMAAGKMTIQKTFQKDGVVCRLVSEDERIEGVNHQIAATYCLSKRGTWE